MIPFRSPFLLGIDVGTSGCKAEMFDRELTSLASSYKEYKMLYGESGWVEEDPEEWWRAVKITVRNVLDVSQADHRDISGMSISCTNACIPVDKAGEALTNAIMQVDSRAEAQAEWMKRSVGEAKVFEITGNRIAPGTFMAPTILWIKENRPWVFDETFKFLTPTGFIVRKLTGEFTMDWSRCSTTLLFETTGGKQWSAELCEELGIPLDKLPTPYKSVEVVDEVTGRAGKDLGVAKGTPVMAGCMDTVAASLGSGVTSPGKIFYVLGSVGRLCYCLDKPFFDNRFLNACHAVDGLWLSIGLMYTSGLSLRWFKEELGNDVIAEAKKAGVEVYRVLDRMAEESPPGSKGLIFLPYLAGERSPIWDPKAKGMLFGLTLRHGYNDILRAIEEGVAYSVRENIEASENLLNKRFDSIVVSGGGSRSKTWLQVISDVTGKKLKVKFYENVEPKGDAVIAGLGSKIFKNMEEPLNNKSEFDLIVTPRKRYYSRYSHQYDVYKSLYKNLRGAFADMADLTT